MKKIDFKKVEVTDIEGNKTALDISKELGNQIYKKTGDLGELELAREIYKNGEVEIDEAQATALSRYIKEGFLAFVQEPLCKKLDNLFTTKK